MPGPVPKRSDQRRRRNASTGPGLVKATSMAVVEVPDVDADWHPIAADWFRSLADSGQAQFYEPSDWATARYVAEAMSRNLQAGRFSGQMFSAVMSAMTELLTTEGARRRARIELERDPGEQVESPGVAQMEKYRRAAAG